MAAGINSCIVTSCRADGPWGGGGAGAALVGPGDRGYMGRTPGTPPLRSRVMASGMNSGVIIIYRAEGPGGEWCRCLHWRGWGNRGIYEPCLWRSTLRSRATEPGMNSEVVTSCRADGPLMWRVPVLALVGYGGLYGTDG